MMLKHLLAMGTALPAVLASTYGNLNLYWGQHGQPDDRLRSYCEAPGVTSVTIAFVNTSPRNGNGYPGTNFAGHCGGETFYPDPETGEPTSLISNCDLIKEDIRYCRQELGTKILLSIGGYCPPGGPCSYDIFEEDEGRDFARQLHDMFGPYEPGCESPRPFDISETERNAVDGFDFDIEFAYADQAPWVVMVDTLRQLNRGYYVTAAPQCPTSPEWLQLRELIGAARFDALFVQFYNNPGCQASDSLNFDDWVGVLERSEGCQDTDIFVSIPASEEAGSGYVGHEAAKEIVCRLKNEKRFGGLSLWDATRGAANVVDGKSFNAHAADALEYGCAEVPPAPSGLPWTSTVSSSVAESSSSAVVSSEAIASSSSEIPFLPVSSEAIATSSSEIPFLPVSSSEVPSFSHSEISEVPSSGVVASSSIEVSSAALPSGVPSSVEISSSASSEIPSSVSSASSAISSKFPSLYPPYPLNATSSVASTPLVTFIMPSSSASATESSAGPTSGSSDEDDACEDEDDDDQGDDDASEGDGNGDGDGDQGDGDASEDEEDACEDEDEDEDDNSDQGDDDSSEDEEDACEDDDSSEDEDDGDGDGNGDEDDNEDDDACEDEDETSHSSSATYHSATTSASAGETKPVQPSGASSAEELTTSTVYTATTRTITSCKPDVPCTEGEVVTETVPWYTTVCPVSTSESTSESATVPEPIVTSAPAYTTSTVHTTKTYVVTSCAPEVPYCPVGQVTTKVTWYTTVCPYTGEPGDHQTAAEPPKSSSGSEPIPHPGDNSEPPTNDEDGGEGEGKDEGKDEGEDWAEGDGKGEGQNEDDVAEPPRSGNNETAIITPWYASSAVTPVSVPVESSAVSLPDDAEDAEYPHGTGSAVTDGPAADESSVPSHDVTAGAGKTGIASSGFAVLVLAAVLLV